MSKLKPKVVAPPQPPAAASKPLTAISRFVAAFIDYARSECHLSANTVAAYRRDLAKLVEWIAGRDVKQLSVRDLADYAAWLHARKLAPASIARHLVSLKVFLPLSAT